MEPTTPNSPIQQPQPLDSSSAAQQQPLPVQNIIQPQPTTPSPLRPRRGLVPALTALCILVFLIAGSILVATSLFAEKPAKNLPHYTKARYISVNQYDQVKNYTYTFNDETTFVTFDEYNELPDKLRLTNVMAKTANDASNTYLQQDIKNDTCRDTGDTITCYERQGDYQYYSYKAGLSESNPLEPVILHDAATNETYFTNFRTDTSHSDTTPNTSPNATRYNPSFSESVDVSPAINPEADFPGESQQLYSTNTSLLGDIRCFSAGCSVYSSLDVQVVNRHFYANHYASQIAQAVPTSDKGLYTYSTHSHSWIHLTPNVDSKTAKDSPGSSTKHTTFAYKIAKNGCSLYYQIKGKAYELDACKL